MHYVAPYKLIDAQIEQVAASEKEGRGAETLLIFKQAVSDIVKLLVQSVDVDEAWYKKQYPDVADAIDDGIYRTAKHHFVDSGYKEGRMPAEIIVDDGWYLKQYPDVAESIKDGLFESAAEHFRLYGYAEGRKPFAL